MLGALGCLDTRLVELSHLATPVPELRDGDWKAQADAALQHYGNEMVVRAEDERFEPIVGGITTLAYFAPDLSRKLADQLVWSQPPERGRSLTALCQAPPPAADAAVYESVWIPLPLDAKTADATVTCDETGTSSRPDHFCLFGRFARRPGPEALPLVLIVHGMFDSSAQLYVRSMGDELLALNMNVLLLDMRDHGQTLRAAPFIPNALGQLEAGDLLLTAAQARSACSEQVSGVGALGVSAGGLDVIQAYAADVDPAAPKLDRGVVAISPLLDIETTIERIERPPTCSLARAVELTGWEYLMLGVAGAATFFTGGVVASAAADRPIDASVAVAAGVGAAFGVGAGLLIDWLADGESVTSDDCLSRGSVASLFQDLLRTRWQSFQAHADAADLSQEARKVAVADITLRTYLELRSWPYYRQHESALIAATPMLLAAKLRTRAVPADPQRAKLLVLSAVDDPVTPISAHDQLQAQIGQRADILVAAVQHGGHGAMWTVQAPAMRTLLGRFFTPSEVQQ